MCHEAGHEYSAWCKSASARGVEGQVSLICASEQFSRNDDPTQATQARVLNYATALREINAVASPMNERRSLFSVLLSQAVTVWGDSEMRPCRMPGAKATTQGRIRVLSVVEEEAVTASLTSRTVRDHSAVLILCLARRLTVVDAVRGAN